MAAELEDFDGDPADEASPTGSAHSPLLPTVDGDVGANEFAPVRRRRPPFEWTHESTGDLIRFVQSMYAKHGDMIVSKTAYELRTTYHDGYEEVRNQFPGLWGVRLSGMLTQYIHLVTWWTEIWTVMDATAATAVVDITTQIERQGMDVENFLSLKRSIDAQREVNIEPLVAAWDGALPSRRVGRIVCFLLDVTHKEFEARQECATWSRSRKRVELQSRSLLEDHQYAQSSAHLRQQYETTNEDIRRAMATLDSEILEVTQIRGKHFNQQHIMHELIHRRIAMRHAIADVN